MISNESTLEALSLKPKQALFAVAKAKMKRAEVSKSSKIQSKIISAINQPEDVEIEITTYLGGEKFKKLAVTADSTPEEVEFRRD
jgi:hypothetical protein